MRRLAHDLCWIGGCAGCGRTLISATWGTNMRGTEQCNLGYYNNRPVFCMKRCRELHGHRVEWWGSTAVRQDRKLRGEKRIR